MSLIYLAARNAKYIHPSFSLKRLFAELGDLRSQTVLREFTGKDSPQAMSEEIVPHRPKILALSVYLWNHEAFLELIPLVRAQVPGVVIVVGGPEAGYLDEEAPLIQLCDYRIQGEGEVTFPDLCRRLLAGERPPSRTFRAPPPDLAGLQSPYALYTDEDLAHRLTYVEASRGCPFGCEFCLSCLDRRVRTFPLEPFLEDMDRLIRRGGRRFKFLDRTFNLDEGRVVQILEFFLGKIEGGLPAVDQEFFVHFEVVPRPFPAPVKSLLARFPRGTLRLEVGIQTLDPATAARIGREWNEPALEQTLTFLRNQTQAVVHADLIAGLPGENLESFARGFDRLLSWVGLGAEIQLGILKKLPGTPLGRHDQEWGMVFGNRPPYQVTQTAHLSASELEFLGRFAKYWELFVNRGRFPDLMDQFIAQSNGQVFRRFGDFTEFFYRQAGRTWGLDLEVQRQGLKKFLG